MTGPDIGTDSRNILDAADIERQYDVDESINNIVIRYIVVPYILVHVM